MHTALTWASKDPQLAPAPRHRPRDGMVWNDTGNPILNDTGIVTGYGSAWVPVNSQITEEINVIVDLTFEHWSQGRQRMPSRRHPGVF